MTAIVRLFESEDAAQAAASGLSDALMKNNRVFTPAGTAGREAELLRAGADEGLVPSGFVRVCAENLQRGRSVVAVDAPVGLSTRAIEIMEAGGAVDNHLLEGYPARNPAPFSDLFCMPVLSTVAPSTGLISGRWHFTGALPLLTGNQRGKAKLSSPKRPWTRSFGMPLLKDSKSKTKLLGPKRPWTTSFGFALLSKNPAPLSSMFGIPTLTKGR